MKAAKVKILFTRWFAPTLLKKADHSHAFFIFFEEKQEKSEHGLVLVVFGNKFAVQTFV